MYLTLLSLLFNKHISLISGQITYPDMRWSRYGRITEVGLYFIWSPREARSCHASVDKVKTILCHVHHGIMSLAHGSAHGIMLLGHGSVSMHWLNDILPCARKHVNDIMPCTWRLAQPRGPRYKYDLTQGFIVTWSTPMWSTTHLVYHSMPKTPISPALN